MAHILQKRTWKLQTLTYTKWSPPLKIVDQHVVWTCLVAVSPIGHKVHFIFCNVTGASGWWGWRRCPEGSCKASGGWGNPPVWDWWGIHMYRQWPIQAILFLSCYVYKIKCMLTLCQPFETWWLFVYCQCCCMVLVLLGTGMSTLTSTC